MKFEYTPNAVYFIGGTKIMFDEDGQFETKDKRLIAMCEPRFKKVIIKKPVRKKAEEGK